MTLWMRTIKLQPEWGMADRREITAQELAKVISGRLRSVPAIRNRPDLTEERDFIADDFDDFAADDTGDFDDLDDLMDRLYDWGDTQIGGEFFNAKKCCWVDAISGAE